MGATNIFGRVASSLGDLTEVKPSFTASLDVPFAGVLLALPALILSGLLHKTEQYFQLPKGYYRLDSIFLVLAFMALSRLKTIEKLRTVSPGEWGKILGLDRIPEAKTLREKIGILASVNTPSQWASELSQMWMQSSSESASIVYIDGHVRVYSGHQTKLPKHYVAREKLCLRATVDYWVNAMDGQPFFLINKAVDPGLIQVLQKEIVPRLENEIPNQPTIKELKSDPYLHRFTLVFDREGYSPNFFYLMKSIRIACLSYHKYPESPWPQEEFVSTEVKLSSGHIVEMEIAERGSFIGKKIWVREIRRRTKTGHQTSIITTDYTSDIVPVAVAMFARWSQENFFKYMMDNFNIDRLIDYSIEKISDTINIVNPEYRQLENERRKKTSQLSRLKAKFSDLILNDNIDPDKVEKYEQKKSDIKDEISSLDQEVIGVKSKLKKIPKHITIGELPEKEKFAKLNTQSKYLVDTIKMIAYRAETAMVNLIREHMSHPDEARSLLQGIYKMEADIIPDYTSNLLKVRLHYLASWSRNQIVQKMCNELNETEVTFPGTNLRMFYELGSQ